MKMMLAAIAGVLFLPHVFSLRASPRWRVNSDGSTRYSVVTGSFSCTDENKGHGFIMFSLQDVNKRWNQDVYFRDFKTHTANNFVCVRYRDNKWQYDANWKDEKERVATTSWHYFDPVSTDMLVASVDFSNSIVKDLSGSNLAYKAMQIGYAGGDLQYFTNQNATGLEKFGDFRMTGTYVKTFPAMVIQSTTTTTSTSRMTNTSHVQVFTGSVHCTDNNTGNGFIMYSQQDINLRWNNDTTKKDFNHSAKNFVCVRFKESKWQYDANWGDEENRTSKVSWFSFTPLSTDALVASVDYSADTAMDLKGLNSKYKGVQIGYADGDLSFFPDENITGTDDGEFRMAGTFIVVYSFTTTSTTTTTTTITAMKQALKFRYDTTHRIQSGGFRCSDANTGSGFIMYTNIKVNNRWKLDPQGNDFKVHKAENFVCIRYKNNTWQYDSNWADETGRPSNISWYSFHPLPTDVAVATVDYESRNVYCLKGTNSKYRNLQIGYASGNLKISANGISLAQDQDQDLDADEDENQDEDDGESTLAQDKLKESGVDFTATGTYIVAYGKPVAAEKTTTTTTLLVLSTRPPMSTTTPSSMYLKATTGGLSCTDSNTGSGYIMYTQQEVNSRWKQDAVQNDFRRHTAINFVCVRYKDKMWQYDCNWEDEQDRASNVSWHEFVPASTDVLVAQVDFTNDKVADLKGQNLQFKGIQIGYSAGDIFFFPNQRPDMTADAGEFRVNGTSIVANVKKGEATTTTTTTPSKGTRQSVVSGGIRCTDNNTGSGFIMYSQQDVNLRWNIDKDEATFRQHTAKNFVCIRYKDQKWEFDTNWGDEPDRNSSVSWNAFVPVSSDTLVASVDYSADSVAPLKGSKGSYKGMSIGYKDGDLKFFADQSITGTADDGEFRIAGTYFIKNTR